MMHWINCIGASKGGPGANEYTVVDELWVGTGHDGTSWTGLGPNVGGSWVTWGDDYCATVVRRD